MTSVIVVVLEEPVDRAVAEDVVGDVLDELGLVGRRQRGPLLGQRGVQLVVDATAQVVLGEALVVEDRTELVDQVVVDLLAELVEHRIASTVAPVARRRPAPRAGACRATLRLLLVHADRRAVSRHA